MNLIIDIGNTVSKYYLFDGSEIRGHGHQTGHSLEFMSALLDGTAYGHHTPLTPEAAIVCSVINLPEEAEARLRALPCPVLRFSADTPIPLSNGYKAPYSLGMDRLAAAIGAHTLYPERPLLVIDAGSCITFDFVTSQGEYVGGNITPGLQARLMAIDTFFPRLPKVEAQGEVPELGYDTETAIRAGVIQGIRHEIQGYIKYFKEKHTALQVVLTGGDSPTFQDLREDSLLIEPDLVARGLARVLIYNSNRHIQENDNS